jgi:SnoaL-like polyketide cyclase
MRAGSGKSSCAVAERESFWLLRRPYVAEGDLSASHILLAETHQAESWGIAPPEPRFASRARSLIRVTNGKMAERFVLLDTLGLMQQLDVIRRPPADPEDPSTVAPSCL